MGYYTGNGVTSGGGETTRQLKSFVEYGAWCVRQKSVFYNVKKAGVSLATAQASHISENLTCVSGGSGSLAWTVFDAEGTRVVPTYSRIGDTNLYELNEAHETLTAWLASTNGRSLT